MIYINIEGKNAKRMYQKKCKKKLLREEFYKNIESENEKSNRL